MAKPIHIKFIIAGCNEIKCIDEPLTSIDELIEKFYTDARQHRTIHILLLIYFQTDNFLREIRHVDVYT